MKIAVVTPSRSDRADLLSRAIASVNAQTVQPYAHIIGIDHSGIGPAQIRNELIAGTDADWIAFLDDDDYLDPHHLETLASRADEADVIIPHCRFDGPPIPHGYYNRPYRYDDLRKHGIFPITVLVRKEAMLGVGGFDPEERYEDWAMWNRMAMHGYGFCVVPEITWTYTTAHHDRRTKTG